MNTHTHTHTDVHIYGTLRQCSTGMQAGACCRGIRLQVSQTQWWGVAPQLGLRGQNNGAAVQPEQQRARPADLSAWQCCSGCSGPETLSLHIQWRVGGQEHVEMEGNSQRAIIKWSPLYWWLKQSDTVRLHPEYITFSVCEEVKSFQWVSAQLEIINLWVSGSLSWTTAHYFCININCLPDSGTCIRPLPCTLVFPCTGYHNV